MLQGVLTMTHEQLASILRGPRENARFLAVRCDGLIVAIHPEWSATWGEGLEWINQYQDLNLVYCSIDGHFVECPSRLGIWEEDYADE